MVTMMQVSTAGNAVNSQASITPSGAARQLTEATTGLPSGSPAAVVEPVVVEALYPYAGDDQNHLQFARGDLIEVWGRESSGWRDGILIKSRSHERGARGWFPSSEFQALAVIRQQCLSTYTIRATIRCNY